MTSITEHVKHIVDTAGIRMSESRPYSLVQPSALQQLQLLVIVAAGSCFMSQVPVLLGLETRELIV